MKKVIFPLCLGIIALFCSVTTKAAENDIRRIDFQNFTYQLGKSWCSKQFHKSTLKVRNGSFDDKNDTSFQVDPDRTVYGDLTGDGQDEAIVITYCGGNQPMQQAFVFTMKDGHAVLLAKLEEGARAFGGIVDRHLCEDCGNGIKIENGLLMVDRMHGDAACCPKYIESKTYRWNGKQLVQTGPGQRKQFIEKRQ